LEINKDEGLLSEFGWDKKLVILRKDRIYFYKNRDVEKADGNFVIKEIETIEPQPKTKDVIYIKFKQGCKN